MLSYVILISIAIAISMGVYSWWKIEADISPPVDCKEGTSIILRDYSCLLGEGIVLDLKNNGRFSIDGIILKVGNDTKKALNAYLVPAIGFPSEAGYYAFAPALKPGKNQTAGFSNKTRIEGSLQEATFDYIRTIQIQPFITDKNKIIMCTNAVISQDIGECLIKE